VCVVSLCVMHNISFKSDTVAFDFLVSKSTQKLGFEWRLRVIKCALSFDTIFVGRSQCMWHMCVTRCLIMRGCAKVGAVQSCSK